MQVYTMYMLSRNIFTHLEQEANDGEWTTGVDRLMLCTAFFWERQTYSSHSADQYMATEKKAKTKT